MKKLDDRGWVTRNTAVSAVRATQGRKGSAIRRLAQLLDRRHGRDANVTDAPLREHALRRGRIRPRLGVGRPSHRPRAD